MRVFRGQVTVHTVVARQQGCCENGSPRIFKSGIVLSQSFRKLWGGSETGCFLSGCVQT